MFRINQTHKHWNGIISHVHRQIPSGVFKYLTCLHNAPHFVIWSLRFLNSTLFTRSPCLILNYRWSLMYFTRNDEHQTVVLLHYKTRGVSLYQHGGIKLRLQTIQRNYNNPVIYKDKTEPHVFGFIVFSFCFTFKPYGRCDLASIRNTLSITRARYAQMLHTPKLKCLIKRLKLSLLFIINSLYNDKESICPLTDFFIFWFVTFSFF